MSESLVRSTMLLKEALQPQRLVRHRGALIALGVVGAGTAGLLAWRHFAAGRPAADPVVVARPGRVSRAARAVLDNVLRTAWNFVTSAVIGSLVATQAAAQEATCDEARYGGVQVDP